MTAREADGQERLGGVDRLREQVRRQREGAEVFEHGGGVDCESIGIIDGHPSYQLDSWAGSAQELLIVDVNVEELANFFIPRVEPAGIMLGSSGGAAAQVPAEAIVWKVKALL